MPDAVNAMADLVDRHAAIIGIGQRVVVAQLRGQQLGHHLRGVGRMEVGVGADIGLVAAAQGIEGHRRENDVLVEAVLVRGGKLTVNLIIHADTERGGLGTRLGHHQLLDINIAGSVQCRIERHPPVAGTQLVLGHPALHELGLQAEVSGIQRVHRRIGLVGGYHIPDLEAVVRRSRRGEHQIERDGTVTVSDGQGIGAGPQVHQTAETVAVLGERKRRGGGCRRNRESGSAVERAVHQHHRITHDLAVGQIADLHG